MALKKGTEIATIDCILVTVKVKGSSDELIIDTSSKIAVEPQVETVEAQKLIVKGRLIAQKGQQDTITGHKITLTDNVFIPELVAILQGGTVTINDSSKAVTAYTPPVAGATEKGKVFELSCYSAQYNAAGIITQYERIVYPNCQGSPIGLGSEDGVFRVSEYAINSAPDTGEAPYKITYLSELPSITA